MPDTAEVRNIEFNSERMPVSQNLVLNIDQNDCRSIKKIGRGLVCTTFNTEQSKMHVWGDSTSHLFLSSARNRVVWNTLHAPLRFLVKRITKKHKKKKKNRRPYVRLTRNLKPSTGTGHKSPQYSL